MPESQSLAVQATRLALEWPAGASFRFAALFAQALNCSTSAVWLTRPGTEWLTVVGHYGISGRDLQLLQQTELHMKGEKLACQALKTEQIKLVWTSDLQELGPTEGTLMQAFGLSTLYCCALRLPDGAYGVMYAASREVQQPETGQIVLAAQVAQSLTVGLYNQELRAQARRSERRFQRITDHSLDLMMVLQGSTITYVNPSCEHILGYTQKEMLGTDFTGYVHPEDLEKTLQAAAQLSEEQDVMFFQNRFVHQSGRTVHLEWNSVFVDGETIGMARDVTGRMEMQEELLRRQQELEFIAQNAATFVAHFNRDLERVYQSPNSHLLHGYHPDELPATLTAFLVHPLDQERLSELIQQGIQEGWRLHHVEFRMRHRSGRSFWVQTAIRFLWQEGHFDGLILTTMDVSDRVEAQLQLQEALEDARGLVDFTVRLEETQDFREVTRVALEHCVHRMPFNMAIYIEFQGEGPVVEQVATRDLVVDPEVLEQVVRDHFRQVGDRELALLTTHRMRLYDPDAATWMDCQPGLLFPSQQVILSVQLDGQLRGVIALSRSRQDTHLEETTLKLLRAIQDRINHAAERSLHLHQLASSREETLRTLGIVLEHRDFETRGHTDRVVELSVDLGRTLGLGEEELLALRWGAFLHDTGKMAISDAILLKPGRLTPEEFEVVKKHSQIGFDMLRHIPTLTRESLQVVLHHHEKWDGTGYPAGLKGTGIPFLARIFTVVDVYDALVSRRPYKEPFSHEDAMQEIERCSGGMFDPGVVVAFSSLMRSRMQGR
ncbi:HD domain-containing phosphohydrolase [Deinococcus cellulosilyticus]|uniref:Uncharacterized protein n=1 Tax=Deinococcus cellulosilyticus (strain DSM 18568 / NBRC 106333 / KACC 11606 / 5516J-15) TaxID=1223518 RepID=A0A511N257_DEIC1|nr:HD domain-containing phosphohydrolase [Deinococcus cellulosilyticus]GEM46933.1 hypothetical protein DC3_25680 [Deinococcus cellulosilyticus NBRC 106333 = KACC 11606]